MKLKTYIILFIVFASTLMSSSRVAFSRPNLVYKTPGSYFPDLGEGKVSLGLHQKLLILVMPSRHLVVLRRLL